MNEKRTCGPSAAWTPMEELENRLLCKAPWGAFPRMVGQVDALSAYPKITGAGMSVAVIDTGINYKLPQLGGGFGPGRKVIAGWNFISNNGNPMDYDGHGTGVASVIAASRFYFEGQRYIGVAPGANLIALKVDDGVNQPPASRIAAALNWVIAHRTQYNIVAVNISEGNGSFSNKSTSGGYDSQLATLARAGVFIAAAAGNDGTSTSVEYPAADPNVAAVGSINISSQVSTFSDGGDALDLLAPGEGIPVLYLDSQDRPVIVPATGTSFSAPFAAGTAALMKQLNRWITPGGMLATMEQTGTKVTDWRTGRHYSRINVMAALWATDRRHRGASFSTVRIKA